MMKLFRNFGAGHSKSNVKAVTCLFRRAIGFEIGFIFALLETRSVIRIATEWSVLAVDFQVLLQIRILNRN